MTAGTPLHQPAAVPTPGFRAPLDLMNFDRTARDMSLAMRMLRLRHGRKARRG